MYLLFQIPSFHSPGSSTPMYDNCEKSESPLSLGDRSQDKCCFRKTYVFTRKENYHQIKKTYAFNRMDTWTKNALDEKRIYFIKVNKNLGTFHSPQNGVLNLQHSNK